MREATNYCASGFPANAAQLPTVWVVVQGRRARALVDTGCSRSIVAKWLVGNREVQKVKEVVTMMNGAQVECLVAVVLPVLVSGLKAEVSCLVTEIGAGFDVLLGMDAVGQLGGVAVSADGRSVKFGGVEDGGVVAMMASGLVIKDVDFDAVFESGKWTVKWKWCGDPPVLENQIASYNVPVAAVEEFTKEIEEWISLGWLQEYNGPCD